MKKPSRILTGVLGFIMLMPGLAKFTEPFKTFIYKHLDIIGFPFPDLMQYAVKLSEIGVGLLLLFLAFKGSTLNTGTRTKLFNISHLTVFVMMLVAVYTHLHPDVPADILPMEYKPPVMPIGYIVLVLFNVYLFRKKRLK